MTLRRLLSTLVMSGALLVAAYLSVGVPDWNLASQFLFGSFSSVDAALALAAYFCWALIIIVVVVSAVLSLRRASEAQIVQRRWTRATMYMAAGVAVLLVGFFHHSTGGYAMCCASDAKYHLEAQQLVQAH